MFDVVVAADLDWGIGKSNGLPWPKLSGDLAHFKQVTCAAPEGRRNAVVMGRNTWESKEVSRRPLPRRMNVVVTRRELAVPDGVLVARSLDDALAAAADCHATFVAGGAVLYREAFEHRALRWVYLTRIDGRFGCDVAIPDLDALGFRRVEWEGAREAEDGGVRYVIERRARSVP